MLHRRKRSDFLRYFLPITTVAVISTISAALFLSTLFMGQALRILQDREEERLDSAMKLFSRIQLGSIPAYVDAIENGPIRDYLHGKSWSLESTLRALEQLDRTLIGNDFIDSFYLYHHSYGILSTFSGYEGFENPPSDPELMQLLSRIQDYGLSRYITRRLAFEGDKSPRNLFTVVIGSPPSKGHEMRLAFIANLSERRIRATLTTDGNSASTMYILDGEGRFLSHPEAERFGTLVGEDLRFAAVLHRSEEAGSIVVTDKLGERWIAAWKNHPEINWRFITLTPEKVVFAPVLHVRNLVILSLLVLLILAVLTAYILSISMSKSDRHANTALAFLRGELDEDESRAFRSLDTSRHYFPNLKFPCTMACVVIEAPDLGSHTSLHTLENALKERFSSRTGGIAEVLRITDNSFAVLYAASSQDSPTRLSAVLKELSAHISFGLGAYCIQEDLDVASLPIAYRVLKNAFQQDFLRSAGSVIPIAMAGRATVIPRKDARDLDYASLEKAFRMDSPEDASRKVSALCADLREIADGDLFRYATSLLSRRIPELLGDEAELLLPGGVSEFSVALSKSVRLEEAEALLLVVAGKLSERGELHTERKRRELIAKIKQLIEDRLSDQSLGTAGIASEVGLSAGYLRDVFKKSEGIALLEYLGTRRLERAKELLLNSNISVREVCDQSGFISYSYFFTYFKKSLGQTPSEFRNLQHHK